MSTELRPLLTKKEAAKQLQMSVRNLEILVNDKKAIAVIRFGERCVRFRPEDLEAFIERQTVPAESRDHESR
jgi:excisionase family DNA binding protein